MISKNEIKYLTLKYWLNILNVLSDLLMQNETQSFYSVLYILQLAGK